LEDFRVYKVSSIRINFSFQRIGEIILKDCNGNELEIGDYVVYIRDKNSGAFLDTGKVTKFYKDRYGTDECSVGSQTHIIKSRIMKLQM